MASFSQHLVPLITSLIFICLCVPSIKGVNDTLQFVHVLYRHGDRGPISFYTNDPYQHSATTYWPEGLGQLTKRGKSMEYALGTWLRKRYKTFISASFVPTEMNVISTDYDRTLMSAQCVLAAFFYPTNETRFNENITWIPTPIHTSPPGADKLLNLDGACPRISTELTRMQALPEVQHFLEKHRELFEYLSLMSGQTLKTVLEVDFLFDTLKIEEIYNLTLPDWALDRYKEMEEVGGFSFSMNTLTLELRRLRGGPLVSLMTNNMVDKIHKRTDDTKMYMFSAHDSTVAILLSSLGVYNKMPPPYAATVLIELHNIDGKNIVKTFYQNDSSMVAEARLLTIPGCEAECPIDDWVKLLSDVTPNDWDSECYRPNPIRDHYFIVGLSGLSSVFGMCLIIISLWLAGIHRYLASVCKRNEQGYKPLTGVTVVTPHYGSLDSNGSNIIWTEEPRSL